jgi:hypothetical protein
MLVCQVRRRGSGCRHLVRIERDPAAGGAVWLAACPRPAQQPEVRPAQSLAGAFNSRLNQALVRGGEIIRFYNAPR